MPKNIVCKHNTQKKQCLPHTQKNNVSFSQRRQYFFSNSWLTAGEVHEFFFLYTQVDIKVIDCRGGTRNKLVNAVKASAVSRYLRDKIENLPPSDAKFPPVIVLDANSLEFDGGRPYDVISYPVCVCVCVCFVCVCVGVCVCTSNRACDTQTHKHTRTNTHTQTHR